MHGGIETSLAKLNHMAAEVFNALMIDTAAAEYSAPKKTCGIIVRNRTDKVDEPF